MLDYLKNSQLIYKYTCNENKYFIHLNKYTHFKHSIQISIVKKSSI